MNRINHIVLILLGSFVLCTSLPAQGLKKLKEKKPFSMYGSIGANSNYYSTNGPTKFPNLTYGVSGNMGLRLYGINIPVTLVFSNQQLNYRQSINQIGISPKYKWITVHGGYRNITFGKYTLAGHTMLGGGIELKPKNWDIGFLYGRLNKANRLDTSNSTLTPITFGRKMGAFKVGYNFKKKKIRLMLSGLVAKDDENSVSSEDQLGTIGGGVRPAHNVTSELMVSLPITKFLKLQSQGAVSYYTDDVALNYSIAEPSNQNLTNSPSWISNFITRNQTTGTYYALENKLNFTGIKKRKITGFLMHKRIDPSYQTMGAYFFQNDFEHYLINVTSRLAKNKIRLNGSIGQQRDNLKGQKLATTKRLIGSARASYNSKKFGLNANYYSYNNNQKPRLNVIGGLLKLTQTSKRVSVTPRYMWGDTITRQSLTISGSVNFINDFQGELSSASKIRSLNTQVVMMNYSVAFLQSKLNLNLTPNLTILSDDSNLANYKTVGVSMGLQKRVLKDKMNIGLSGGYFEAKQNGKKGAVINSGMNASYTITKKIRAGMYLIFNKSGISHNGNGVTQTRGIFNLTYSFK